VNAKRLFVFICACSMAVLLWPSDALAQRGGGGGRGGGGAPAGRGGGPGPQGGQGGHGGNPSGGPGRYPSGGHGGYNGGYNGGYRGGYGYYRPAYYRPYYSYYRPYYNPYFYNGFYSSFYFGLGWYPYYASFGYGYRYPYYGAYYGAYGYPYAPAYGYAYPQYPYPYPGYGYTAWSSARLEVKPRDAQVYVDGNFVGSVDQFDGVFQRLDVPAGEHEITVYMPGYHSYSERTLFRPGEGYHYKAVLEPLPPGAPQDPKPQPQPRTSGNGPDPNQPGYGNQPPGYGNDPNRPGDPYGQQPPPRDPAPYGRTQPPPADRDHVVAGGGFATLSLRVQPTDASVQIDGERWDSPEGGSRLVVQLTAGQHRIDVRKDGFRPYSTTITIRPGEPQTLNISLPQQELTLRGTR
jgi:PEGA domain